ncbi:DUF4386 domain-containing protein [Ekhidna sp.]|uniref:DUF4386 domain-containing protein n=1 Tax=Ekhidna sp. TaxID=2608089 RepID=UPI003C7C3DA6
MHTIDQQKTAVTWLRIIYPLWAVLGMFSLMYVPSVLIDLSDAQLTASNISANQSLFRLGIAGSLVTQLIGLAAVYYLYKLFYNDHKEGVILLAVFTFLGMPISMASSGGHLMVLESLNDPVQVIAILKQSGKVLMISTIFWGLWLFPLGAIIIKSPLFPKVIGWLVILAGVGYTVAAFAYFLGIEGVAVDALEYLTFGEVIWMLWVLIMGARWKAMEA